MLRRVVWVGYMVLWSLALVTPQPVRASHAVLPEGLQFPAPRCCTWSGYALLCALTGWQRLGTPRWRPLILLALSAHACLTELIQRVVPERHGSWDDVTLNHVGLYLGIALAWRWWRE